jgi:hypothetical protein
MDTAALYAVCVDGLVPEDLVPRLGGLEIGPGLTGQTTRLSGALSDQAALLGVLLRHSYTPGAPCCRSNAWGRWTWSVRMMPDDRHHRERPVA